VPTISEHSLLGRRGERAAMKYLRRRGLRIVAQSLRTPHSELDLIGVDGRTIVFIEVKTRSADSPQTALEAVDSDKRRRLTNAALAYLRAHHLLEYASRFDIVAVNFDAGSRKPRIEHVVNAFEPAGRFQMFS
jgi:putative endonuclease